MGIERERENERKEDNKSNKHIPETTSNCVQFNLNFSLRRHYRCWHFSQEQAINWRQHRVRNTTQLFSLSFSLFFVNDRINRKHQIKNKKAKNQFDPIECPPLTVFDIQFKSNTPYKHIHTSDVNVRDGRWERTVLLLNMATDLYIFQNGIDYPIYPWAKHENENLI